MSNITVEIVYQSPAHSFVKAVSVPVHASVRHALIASHCMEALPHEAWETLKVGIFGKRCLLSTRLVAGDRIEIYRPLKADPKVIRHRRAQIRALAVDDCQ